MTIYQAPNGQVVPPDEVVRQTGTGKPLWFDGSRNVEVKGIDESANIEGPEAPAEGAPKKTSQATELVKLATDRYDFAATTTGEPFAIPKNGPFVARMLRGGRDSLRAELADSFHDRHGRPPSAQAAADAALVLEGRARRAEAIDPALRVASHHGALVLDLGTKSGRVVVITAEGWRLVDKSPVLFRRTALTGELPEPEPGGNLRDVVALLNISDKLFDVIVGYVAFVLFPHVPHPVLVLAGEQGSAKSTAARIVSSWIDPSPAQLRTHPRDLEQFAVAVSASCVVAFDNMSTVAPWLSDAICRAVTGDAMVRRRLYSNDDLSVIAYRRAVMLNGIDLGPLRGDLAERALRIEFGSIAEDKRRQDADVLEAWRKLHPKALGALLDLASGVLRVLPDVHLDRLPRMADFARVLAAVDAVRGTGSLRTYLGMAGSIAEDVIEDDPVASAVRAFVAEHDSWTGTAGELADKITAPDPKLRDWPATGQAMATVLKRTAPAFRSVGMTMIYNDDQRPRTWTLVGRIRDEAGTSDIADKVTDTPSEQEEPVPDGPSPARHLRQADLEGDGQGDIALTRENVSSVSSVTPQAPISVPGSGDDPAAHDDAVALVMRAFPASEIVDDADA